MVELVGTFMSEAAHLTLPEKRYVIALADPTQPSTQGSAPEALTYVDLREAGSVARLVRSCTEAANLELVMRFVTIGPYARFSTTVITHKAHLLCHSVALDNATGYLGDLFDIIAGSSRDLAEEELLRDSATKCNTYHVNQRLLGVKMFLIG